MAPGKEFGITLNYYKSSMKVIVAGAGDEIWSTGQYCTK